MNVVVVDSGVLGLDADFPMLEINKFGWEQFLDLQGEDVVDRCWRSDIIVSATTPIDRAVIDKAFKLKLIVAAGDTVDHIDLDAARERDITVCHVPGMTAGEPADMEIICNQVVDNINAFIRGEPKNII